VEVEVHRAFRHNFCAIPYTYQYDTANQLKQVNSSTCTNDGNGNQTGCGTSYKEVYNARNQTTSASSPNGNLTHQYVGTDSTERVSTGGSHAATYTINVLGLGTEKDSSGNLVAYTRDTKGNLISERTASGNYYYLFDGLGSVVALMPPSAADVTNTYLYDPYGVTEHQTGTQYNPWQFASGYLDASTLYYKYGTRYYDRFGRWTQQDPQPSANPYLYANDDPVNLVDPSGRDCVSHAIEAALDSVIATLAAAGYLTSLLTLAAGDAAETTILAFLFSITAPSVLGSLLIAGGIVLAALAIADAIQECRG